MELSKAEEQLMTYLWKKKKAYLKELLEAYPDPKPAITTVATFLKRMTRKGYIGYRKHGRSREYFPTVRKADYFSGQVEHLINVYFDGNAVDFTSAFLREFPLSEGDLKSIRKFLDQRLKKVRA